MQYFHLRQETCLPPCPHSCSALLSCSEAALSYWVSSCSSTLNCFIIYEHWLKSKALLLISSFKDSMWTHTHTSHKFHDIHIVWNENPSVCLWGCQSQIHVSALPKTSHMSTFRVSCQVSQLKQGRRGRGWRGLLFWSVFSWIKYVIRHANTARQFLSFNSREAMPITEGKCLFNR